MEGAFRARLPQLRAALRRLSASDAGERRVVGGGSFLSAGDRVPNLGSTARDHLANERTFLSWARTGLGFLGSGTGLFTAYHLSEVEGGAPAQVDAASFMLVRAASRAPPPPLCTSRTRAHAPTAAVQVANGGLVLSYAAVKYFRNQRALMQGEYIMAKKGLIGICAFTALSTSSALALVHYGETSRQSSAKRGAPD